MASTLEELEVLRTKYKNLQCEWDNQQEHLGRIQGELFKMRAQLKNQSSFCASLGAIMGNLMWKTSRLPNAVDTLLTTVRNFKFSILYFLQMVFISKLVHWKISKYVLYVIY